MSQKVNANTLAAIELDILRKQVMVLNNHIDTLKTIHAAEVERLNEKIFELEAECSADAGYGGPLGGY